MSRINLWWVSVWFLCQPALATSPEQVNKVLDEMHKAASTACFDCYFGLYASDAVFIGTDVSETWTLDQFKAYAKPVFAKGQGWTYRPQQRQVNFDKSGSVAWFVEILENASLGTTRGSGVLEKQQGKWKIKQYHLAIPVPHALAEKITGLIRQSPLTPERCGKHYPGAAKRHTPGFFTSLGVFFCQRLNFQLYPTVLLAVLGTGVRYFRLIFPHTHRRDPFWINIVTSQQVFNRLGAAL